MKRTIALVLGILVLVLSTGAALAGGGQNTEQHRGDKGQGETHQNQERNR